MTARRWQNPVTRKSQFMGFHRLEQILWDEPSLTGATALCQGLMDHEEKLAALVSKAKYSPQEMAAGVLGGTGAVGAGLLAGATGGYAAGSAGGAGTAGPAASAAPVPFYGPHQAGIITPPRTGWRSARWTWPAA
jgi:hypothetical protein